MVVDVDVVVAKKTFLSVLILSLNLSGVKARETKRDEQQQPAPRAQAKAYRRRHLEREES